MSIISAGERMTFAAALVLIFFARDAKFNVYTDSSRCTICLLAVQMRVVFEFPPSASFKKNVNFEFRKGTCGLASVNALIQLPRYVKLLLILVAYLRMLPSAPVFD